MTTPTPKTSASTPSPLLWLLLAGLVTAGATYLSTNLITTDIGFETVLLNQPLLGDFRVEAEALNPGRSLQLFTVRGVQVKTDRMRFYLRYNGYSGPREAEDTIQVELVAKSKDSVALVSKFGEFWYTDHVAEVLRQSVEDVAREYANEPQVNNKLFQKDFSGQLTAVVRQNFHSAGIPLIVQSVTGEYSRSSRTSYRTYSYKSTDSAIGQGIRDEY
jgi:hypothetical protein